MPCVSYPNPNPIDRALQYRTVGSESRCPPIVTAMVALGMSFLLGFAVYGAVIVRTVVINTVVRDLVKMKSAVQ